MSDRMNPIPFADLMDWVLEEKKEHGSIFGVREFYYADQGKTLDIFGGKLETPFGPAAGPHTQLAQNIIAAYAAGSRFFELKTVQILDGEDLPVSKPCIDARDECYNVEWSTELRVPDAYKEYVRAWFALKLLSKEFGFGSPDGFVFNMSVGYDLAGIQSPKIDAFINGMMDASGSDVWKECMDYALENLGKFENVDRAYVESISPVVSRSITESTLHGCPPKEIEKIASYLITEKGLNTFIKCNPTLLGFDFARNTMNAMGYDYMDFNDHHFKNDMQYADAVPMLRRLIALAQEHGVAFGVKITNTMPVNNPKDALPGDEMYMSGRSLFPLSIEVANRLSKEFDGKLRISFSGGADAFNITDIFHVGIWPITQATTLLKPGGYQRLIQQAKLLADCDYTPFAGIDVEALDRLAKGALTNIHNTKHSVKPAPSRKLEKKVPLTDCFTAPCHETCPIHQNIPEYVELAGEGRNLDALRVIVDTNPLPFITGTICPHPCMGKCTRNFYEEPVHIREVKLHAAQNAHAELMKELKAPAASGAKAAIVGGGPAGLAAAYFLGRAGIRATVFEKRDSLGGIVRHIIPDFRISGNAIDQDVELVKSMGAEFRLGVEAPSAEELKKQGYDYIIYAVGAWKHGVLKLEKGEPLNVFDFLAQFKADPEKVDLGKHVAVVGGGNTAMDAARAAKRVKGVETVSLVYRRNRKYMPADEEELELAMEDGVEFRELLAPVSLENGGLICEKMVLGEPDASGRRSPVGTGELVTVPADTVIASVGEKVDTALFEQNGITVERGKVCANPETLETNLRHVYVAGDAYRGPSIAVWAIADAKRAAEAILREEEALKAAVLEGISQDRSRALSRRGVLKMACGAEQEGGRCLECNTVCESCVDVCPNRANVAVKVPGKKMTQIVHVDGMCNECGNCMVFCPYDSAPYQDKFTVFSSLKDFEDSKNQGFVVEDAAARTVRVRLDGEEFSACLDQENKLPADLELLILTILDRYPYLLY